LTTVPTKLRASANDGCGPSRYPNVESHQGPARSSLSSFPNIEPFRPSSHGCLASAGEMTARSIASTPELAGDIACRCSVLYLHLPFPPGDCSREDTGWEDAGWARQLGSDSKSSNPITAQTEASLTGPFRRIFHSARLHWFRHSPYFQLVGAATMTRSASSHSVGVAFPNRFPKISSHSE
jgi:hypothetical protein